MLLQARTMHPHDYEAEDPERHDEPPDEDAELTYESLLWQLLLLINPGDEESAREQFHAWEELQPAGAQDESEALAALRQAIDWRAGFTVEADDPGGLIECVDELAARFGLVLEWQDDDAAEPEDVPALLGRAYEQLREHGYSLWTWGVHGAPREDLFAGWITLRSEDEALEIVAPALGIELRPGSRF
jgi:hypothetical protein